MATSIKSYSRVREHMEATQTFVFILHRQEITADYEQSSTTSITLHDGSVINLLKRGDKSDIMNRAAAVADLEKAKEEHHILTGILFLDPKSKDTHEILEIAETPFNLLSEKELCPGNEIQQTINDSFR